MQTNRVVQTLALLPVPLIFTFAFAAGVALQQLAPIQVAAPLHTPLYALGLCLLNAGGLLALSTIGLFFLAHTSVLPFNTASSLVTRGPYRFSRNPMYISLLLAYLGTAIHYLQPWPLLLMPLPMLLLTRIVIPFEELRLKQLFGDAYERYCLRVRRWL